MLTPYTAKTPLACVPHDHAHCVSNALADADIFIAIGTSGHVYPAAGFVHEARLQGAHTVELNLEPSQVGSEFAEKHYGLASEVVPAFVDRLLKDL